MSARFVSRALGALLGILLAAGTAPAAPPGPPPFTALGGIVKDSTGRSLPNAQVAIPELNRGTTTNDEGRFTFHNIPAGTYHVRAQLIGYRPGHADVTVPATGPDVDVTITLVSSPLRLSSIVVSASPTGSDIAQLTHAATELSDQALLRSVGASISQTLAAEPGLAMRFNGPAANAPIIRGLHGDRILMLQDGERTGDLSSAAPDHAVSIDPLAAQRVEVVRGPASLLYGNNALGGVVNVITNDIPSTVPSHVEGTFAAQGETVNPGVSSHLSITAPLGSALAFTLTGGQRSTQDMKTGGGGTLEKTQTRSWNGTAGLGFQASRVNGGVVYREYEMEYGLPNEEGSPDIGTHIKGHRYTGSGHLQFDLGSKTFPELKLEGTAQHYAHDELSPEGDVNTAFDLKTQTVSATLKTAFGKGKGVIGAQGLFKQYGSTGSEALTPAADTKAFGGFFYHEVPLQAVKDPDDLAVRLQFGGRFDSYDIQSFAGIAKFGPGQAVNTSAGSGSVGLSIPLGGTTTLGLSVARAFRAPTVEELFSNAFHAAEGMYDKGNKDLKPETNSGFDAILRWQSGSATGTLSGYYNRISNFVVPDVTKDTLFEGAMVPLNNFGQADATLYGIEGSLETIVARQLVWGVMGDMVHGELVGGAPVPFMPPARIGTSLRWDNGTWNVGGEVRHAFKQDRVSGGAADIPTDAYTLLNASIGVQLIAGGRVHSLTLRGENLGDTKYFDSASRIKSFAPNPGRNIALVYRVLF